MKNNYLKQNHLSNKKLNYKKHTIFWMIVLFSAPFSYSGEDKELLVYERKKGAIISDEMPSFILMGTLFYDESEHRCRLVLAEDKEKNTVNPENMQYKDLPLIANLAPAPNPALKFPGKYETVPMILRKLSSGCPGLLHLFGCTETYDLLPENDPKGSLIGQFTYYPIDMLYGFSFLNEEFEFIEKLIRISFFKDGIKDAMNGINSFGEQYLMDTDALPEGEKPCSSKKETYDVDILLDLEKSQPVGFKITVSDGWQLIFIQKKKVVV